MSWFIAVGGLIICMFLSKDLLSKCYKRCFAWMFSIVGRSVDKDLTKTKVELFGGLRGVAKKSKKGESTNRIKPEELYILSCEKGQGRRPRPFSQLRM